MTLVDSNVLIDVAADDTHWFDWSIAQIEQARRTGPLLINDIIYAEASVRYGNMIDYDSFLQRIGASHVPIPAGALFLAGKAFAEYRRVRGTKTGVLPDFFIGAHAVTSGLPLLTRDVRRYRTYFPRIDLIAPDDPA